MTGTTRSRVSAQRVAGVQVALAVGDILVRQQDLRGADAVLLERRLQPLHQPHLTDGCRRLRSASAFGRARQPSRRMPGDRRRRK